MENDLISIGNARTLRLDGRRIGVGMRRGVGALSCGCGFMNALDVWSRCCYPDRGAVVDGFVGALGAWRNWRGVDRRLIAGVWVVRAKGFLPAFWMRVLRFGGRHVGWAFGVKNYAKWLTSRASRPVRDIFLRACLGA